MPPVRRIMLNMRILSHHNELKEEEREKMRAEQEARADAGSTSDASAKQRVKARKGANKAREQGIEPEGRLKELTTR